jgi:3-isopropylmalate dehydrogenase
MQLPPEKAEGVFRLRRSLDLFCNIRPVRCLPALVDRSNLKPEVIDGVDLVIVRELTAGVYFGLPRGIQTLANGERDAVDTQRYSTSEIARVAHDAFRIARSRRRRLTSIDKANAMETGRLWRQVVDSIGMSDYPDVAIEHLYADSASMLVVQGPRRTDVILGDNLFGDMISDTASVIAGSPGMLPSASLGPICADDTRRALYQPMLGASHDLAGRGIVNPMGAILCVAMMFEHSLGMPRERGMIEEAVAEVAHAGIVTPDVGGGASTAIVTSAVVDALSDFG